MAKVTKLVDDIDGSDATDTLEFSWGGTNYTIDLCDENADKFREIMALYVGCATKVERPSFKPVMRAAPGRPKSESDSIRAWAKANGHQVASQGRIPQSVLDAYDKRSGDVTQPVEEDLDTAEREVLARLDRNSA